jgi:hypothetical protein
MRLEAWVKFTGEKQPMRFVRDNLIELLEDIQNEIKQRPRMVDWIIIN